MSSSATNTFTKRRSPPAVVVEPLGEAGMRRVERLERVTDRGGLDGHLCRATGKVAQLRWDADRDRHHSSVELGYVASKASIVGAIAGANVGVTASSVLSPWPVT